MAITDKWKMKDPGDPAKQVLVPKDQRRGLRWRADWTEPNGKRRRKDFATKAEAETEHAKRVQQVRRGNYIDPSLSAKLVVTQLNDEFVERMRTRGVRGNKPASAKTLDNYRRRWENYIGPRWGTAPLASVTYEETSDWIQGLAGMDGSPAGDATKRAVASSFGSLMNHAVRLKYLPTNPAQDPVGGVDYMPKVRPERKHVYLTMEELLTLASHAGAYRDLILLAGLCGLRWGEVAALQVQDVALGDKPQINVCRAISELPKDQGGLVSKDPKSGEHRVVPMPRMVAAELAPRLFNKLPGSRVFGSARGAMLHNSNFTKRYYAPAIEAAQAASGSFPRPTFHDLRHTAVSLAIRSGANVKVVQQIAGHASATLTLDTYAGLFTDDLHDSAARLDAAIELTVKASSSLFRHWNSVDSSAGLE